MSILFSWLSPLRAICMAIDGVLYSLLDNAYDLVIKLSTAELLKHSTIKSLTGNLYIIFGVVAFFRLALLLVNAIIDPEKLNEKGKGLSNIFFRVVGMVILLAVTPFLFEKSYDLQEKIVGADASKNIIFKTILGNNANIASSKNSNAGKALQNIALSSLITIDENYLVNGDQCNIGKKNSEGKDCGFYPLTCVSDGKGKCTPQGGYIYGENCKWANCQKAVDLYNEMYVGEDMSPSKLAQYVGTSGKIKIDKEEQEVYVYNYMFIITGVVGVAMTYIIISFAIDIAVRMFELIVLEILSPLFIATFVDPKSAQSGPFKNWLSAVGKSYASLYIRLAIIALMVLLVSIINQSKMFQSMGEVSGWAKIFMVIGLLIFAKKAPKWIGDMIGIKGDGGLSGLSIGKKLGGMALAGGLASKGLDKAKSGLKKQAKRVGAGMINRVGADIGGSLAGIQSAKRNALGDKSLRSIRENEMKRTGSKIKANAAAVKSFFNKDDRDARKEALRNAKADGSLDLKNAAKEGKMRARVEGTDAALDGNFKSAGSLSRSVKKTYDPNYKTHDERVRSDAESKYYSNAGAFNISEIERQKKVQQDLDESRKILGRQTYADEKGDIYLDEAHSMPAIYNEKTLKKFVGEYATNYGDLGTGVIFGAGEGVLMTDSDKTLTINDNGTLRELNVPAGTLLKEKIVDQNGKKVISYEALTENGTFKDKNGNAVDVNLANSSQIRQTADGYEVVDGNNNVVMKARQNRDQTGNVIGVELSNSNGQIVNNSTDSNGNVVLAASKILTEYGMQYAGKTANGRDDSVLAKQLDAAFASMKDKIAANVVKYEGDIGSVKQHKIELQTKLTQQQEQILQISNNTQYGKAITKLQEITRTKSHETDRIQQFTAWIDSMTSSGNDSINVGGYIYSKDEVEKMRSDSTKALRDLSEKESELNLWINNNPDEKTKHDSIITGLSSSINEIKEALEEADKDISVLEVEKNKIDKVASPLRIDGEIINSSNYNNHSEKLSKDVEKFKKIADGSMGEFPSKSNE